MAGLASTASSSGRAWQAGINTPAARWSIYSSGARPFARGAFTRHRRSAPVLNVLRDTESYVTAGGVVDYYEVLGIDDDASPAEIKSAYRAMAKLCHPDFTGDRGHNMCILLNEAYSVLMDEGQRGLYDQQLDAALQDEEDGYTGELLSKWMAGKKMGRNTDPNESRAIFVDEIRCIGCKQCMHISPATYRIEEEYGRSRVFAQWLDTEDNLQASIDCCPVSCIQWVQKDDLPALEFVMQNKTSRPNVGVMMAGQGGAIEDVWASTAKYLKEREAREEKRRAAAKYSAAQDAARRQAAADLRRQQEAGAWWESMLSKFAMDQAAKVMAEAIKDQVMGSPAEEAGEGPRTRVGTRKRINRWAAAAQGGFGGGGTPRRPIPVDRALVPAGVRSEPWRRR